jgi:hypothetical protein
MRCLKDDESLHIFLLGLLAKTKVGFEPPLAVTGDYLAVEGDRSQEVQCEA